MGFRSKGVILVSEGCLLHFLVLNGDGLLGALLVLELFLETVR